MNPLKEYPFHKEILEKLFAKFEGKEGYRILDAGSGRTSLFFLTTNFPNSEITAIVFPGDERKKKGINRDVKELNYVLKEIDIQDYKQTEKFDIVLSHLLLGEATKFANNSFESVLEALLNINTKYLIIIDIENDPDIDFELVLNEVSKVGEIKKRVKVDKYIGYFIEIDNKQK